MSTSVPLDAPVAAPGPQRGMLWADKYKPQCIADMCYPLFANRLKQWLLDWAGAVAADPAKAKRGALLSGPPGIGKTTAVYIVAKELNVTVIEYNASDHRSRKSLREQVSALTTNTVLGAQRFILLMDEVDGCDMGGVGEIILMLKTTRTPILCTCNDRWHQKLRSLTNHVEDFRFSRPPCNLVADWICKRVLAYEGVSLPKQILQDIIKKEGSDIRSVLTNLQIWTLRRKVLDDRTLATCASRSNKNSDVGIFEAAELFLMHPSQTKTFEELQSAFYSADLVDLFIQENYLKFSPLPKPPGGMQMPARTPADDWLNAVADAAASISNADCAQRIMYGEQNWSVANYHLLASSVYPSARVRGHFNPFSQGPAAAFERQQPIKFPSWLGQNSTSNKNARLLSIVAKEGTHPTRGYSGAGADVAMDYLPLGVVPSITKPLSSSAIGSATPTAEQKAAAVGAAIAAMDAYGFVRDDYDFATQVIHFKKLADHARHNVAFRVPSAAGSGSGLVIAPAAKVHRFENDIATATKTALTREFNKTHTGESVARTAGKAAAATSGASQTQTGATQGEGSDDDNSAGGSDDEIDNAVSGKKAKAAPAAAAAKKAPAKPRGKKAVASPAVAGADGAPAAVPAPKKGRATKRPAEETPLLLDDDE